MTELKNYVLTEEIGRSLQAIVYSGYQVQQPDMPLTIKLLKLQIGADEQIRYLEQKVERLRILQDPRTITPLRLEAEAEQHFLVHPQQRGETLDKWFNHNAITIANFMSFACELTDIIRMVHESGIIHGGIKPHNILVQNDLHNLYLTDFITPLDIRDVSHFIYDAGFVRDTLAYTSPEQTGRINHRVGFSSDLYSLGIVFYELLLNRLPFFSTDPLALIHSHLAEEPELLSNIRPVIPEQVSLIIAKLLFKEPEKRYQSASGLLADLEQCQDQFLQRGEIDTFYLGLSDYNRRVTFISKMVGRKKEAQLVLDEYDNVTQGEFRSVFISGLSGIGKTRLIQELQKPLVEHRGYFTSGKFDQYQKNIPYSSLIQALRNLMRTFLTESDEQLQQWKQIITSVSGEHGKIIIDVVPELEYIIGPQPDVPELPPVEARNRFNNELGKFLSVLASAENPLILFIDDLQWCDIATFDFLQFVFANPQDYPFIFFMGAYRHNEVDSSHPLIKLLQTIQEHDVPVNELRIEELSPKYCREMVAYILDDKEKAIASLAKFIIELTGGNPLFVSESLAYLYNENLLHLDDTHQWRWDIDNIRQSNMPTTIVDLFSAKLSTLPKDTTRVIKYAACIGNRIKPDELALILDIELPTLFDIIKPVLNLGVLLENKTDLQFVHDRVQEAVLRTISPNHRRDYHWQIGNKLLNVIPKDIDIEKQDQVFTIASHLNQGLPNNVDKHTQWLMAEINYHAGNKALGALATEAANDFFHKAQKMLPVECWHSNYNLTYNIFQKVAKTELMCGHYEASETHINVLIKNSQTDLDKAEALAGQTTSLSSIGAFQRAIETANRGLEYFDKAIPYEDEIAEHRMQSLMSDIATHQDIWQSIMKMPFTKERKSKIELAFYSELIPDLYMSGMVPQLYLSAAQSTQNCLEGGMDESVIYSFSIMGLNLGEQQQFEHAFHYQDLAHELCERHPNTFGATRGINGIVWCNMHSRSMPLEIVQYCLKGIQSGKNCGDLYNAGLNYGPLMWNLQVQGQNLKSIEDYANECLQFSNKNQLSFSVGLAEAVINGWVMPMKHGHTPEDMTAKLKKWQQDNHISSAGSYFVLLGIAQTYLGLHEQASTSLKRVEDYLTGLTDNVLKRQWFVFSAINVLQLHKQNKHSDISQTLETIAPLLKQLHVWASLGPLLRPYIAYLEAEIESITGSQESTISKINQAIVLASEQGYVLLNGHLHESLAEQLKESDTIQTRKAIQQARLCYLECHATQKTHLLAKRFPDFMPSRKTDHKKSTVPPSLPSLTLPDLDVTYLMKSALAISAETDLEQLLHKIMTVIIELSGAQHGYFISKKQGHLTSLVESHIQKQSNVTKKKVQTLERAINKKEGICLAIVNYVFRTQEKVLLENAEMLGAFTEDKMVKKLQLRSIMCVPVIKQKVLIGVLYIENRLSEGIFTEEINKMTELIIAQAAISLENAQLLQDTRQTKDELRELNETLEQRISDEIQRNRNKDILLIQQSRLAAMGEMIGNIAHQWRQPLNALGLVLTNIKDASDYDELTDDYLADSVAKGNRLVQAMSTTINDFKDFFSPEKERTIFSANDQVNHVMSLIEPNLTATSINVTINRLQDIKIDGYPNEYAQVLLNLISNAKEAIMANNVSQGKITLTIYEKENKGYVTVVDNGGGIKHGILEKVFDPYFSTKEMGTGVGLYMSQMIIQRNMGGEIKAENAGHGAKFSVITQLASPSDE